MTKYDDEDGIRNMTTTSNREFWEFSYPVHQVRDAAVSKRDYHAERVLEWDRELATIEEAIQAEGFQIREHAVTGGQRHELYADPDKVSRMGECKSKIAHHRKEIDSLGHWIAALNQAMDQPEATTIKLKFADVEYFGMTAEQE